jgi:hypothetical protein
MAWAEALSPIAVLAEAPAGPLLDLNAVAGGEDADKLPALLPGHTVAKGGAIASNAGVRAALAAGIKTICASPRLPVLLAAIEAARELQSNTVNDE